MRTHRLASRAVWREVALDDRPRTLSVGRPGCELAVEAAELALVLDSTLWCHEIPGWRFTTAIDDGESRGFHDPDFDDGGWLAVTHLQPLYHVRYEGGGWFRHRFTLPAEARGDEVSFVLGGLDDEDWLSYRIFLNGRELDAWRSEGTWRDSHRTTLHPEEERYGMLGFGRENLLAVETSGIDRRAPWMRPGEEEHYLFQGWLLDQYIATGEPTTTLSGWQLVDAQPSRATLEVELASHVHDGLRATLRYEAAEVLRKRVQLRNESDHTLALLDVILEDLGLPVELSKGGGGQPILGKGVFLGLEHPCGLNQGRGKRARVLQLPGRDLAPGETWTSESAVIGLASAGENTAEAFRGYLRGLRPRRQQRTCVYSALGWYDFTNPADPLHELDSRLVEENLDQLGELAGKGAHFDVYMFDDWWEPTDPESFRRATFPDGGAAAAEQVREHGLEPGLWVAPCSTNWGWGETPGMERALAGGVDPVWQRPADPETAVWSWDDVFSQAFTSAPRLCLAAEPLRGALSSALVRHARELRLACLKIDGPILHCTASDHGHRAGRYALDGAARVLLDAVAAAEREAPGLFVVWYWGARSPWWLAHGDLLFDKGLKLEAASPASAPGFSLRHGITLNTDQAIRHAELVPLELQDSLGVWLGNVAWANRIGKENWREALVLDIARGSSIVQLWGDVSLLDGDDAEFLGEVLAFVRATDDGYSTTVSVGGDPWAGEPYGYARRCGAGAIITLSNPGWESAESSVELAPLGLLDPVAVHEAFPFPAAAGTAVGALTVELAPFEVRCIGLVPGQGEPQAERPAVRATRPLDLERLAQERGAESVWRGAVSLPDVDRGDWVVLTARLVRDGQWWYHPQPHELVRLSARMRGAEVYVETLPRVASQNGPGYPWVVFRMPAGRSWSGQELGLTLRARLPREAELKLQGWVIEPWWLKRPSQFSSRRALGVAA